MKYGKANSLRTQQAIARYGKSARHPLCLAALDLWRVDEEVSVWTKKVLLREELVNSAKQLKKRIQGIIGQFRKEQKEKETNEASAFLVEIDKVLLKTRRRHQAVGKIRSIFLSLREEFFAPRFERERDAARRQRNVKAQRALQRVRKRWRDKGAFLGDTDRRTLEMLKMLDAEVRKAASAKEGVPGVFIYPSWHWALSDEAWQELL
jgi:hypothetical protein